MNQAIRSDGIRLPALLTGLYVLVVGAFLGVTLADTAYRSVLRYALPGVNLATVDSEIGDGLILLFWFTVLAALAAIASCWRHARARNLLIASLALVALLPLLLNLLGSSLGGSSAGGFFPRSLAMVVAVALALFGLARLLSTPSPVRFPTST